MPSQPTPAEAQQWALAALDLSDSESALEAVAGDASARRYFRLGAGGKTYIVALAPPATEKNAEFISIHKILSAAEVRVPGLFAVDLARGFLLLEDLGDQMMLPLLDSVSVDDYYRGAFALAQSLGAVPVQGLSLPEYDRGLLSEELGRFEEWFVEGLLACELLEDDRAIIAGLTAALLTSALEQPRVLVHRDFHSRNLMVLPGGELALIDFQDAVVGPATYDLASLLRDCSISWPPNRVRQWALEYKNSPASPAGLAPVADAQFLRWFDWMGLQRHIKVLGNFARLSVRDGRDGYLRDLPQVLAYSRQVLQSYASQEPAFAAFDAWFDAKLTPLIARQPWSRAS